MRAWIRWMLLGNEGLRTGWRVLIFLILVNVLFVGLRLLLNHALMALAPGFFASLKSGGKALLTPAFAMLNDGFLLLVYLLVLAGMARLERRRFTSFGLNGSRAWRHGLSGLFWGFVMLSALIGLLYVSGHLVFGRMPPLSLALLGSGVLWAIASLLIAFTEENLFRGYLLFTLERGIGFWPAALLLAALFGMAHGTNAGETPIGLFSVGFYALVIALSIAYTRSLWWAIGFHTAWDWAESYFYGTADSGFASRGRLFIALPKGNVYLSGGRTGPEGSVLVFVVLAATAAVIAWTLRCDRRAGPDLAAAAQGSPMH